jgi:hypothetical protein
LVFSTALVVIGAVSLCAAEDCRVSVRLIEADPQPEIQSVETEKVDEEERKQLSGLSYGRYNVLAKARFNVKLGEKGSAELVDGSEGRYHVEVTPHTIADEKVHYTLEWKRTPDESLVATKVGVENGRSVMVGGAIPCPGKEKRSVLVGVNVKCG